MADEIDAAVDRVRTKAKKAPRPNGIPNSVWTIVHRANPGILNAVFNVTLKSGVFPTRWKVAWLLLLQKPGKPVVNPASFWPLYMLDTIGKIFKEVVAEWLWKHFRETINAARRLKKLAASAKKKRQVRQQLSALISKMHTTQCHGRTFWKH